MAHRRLHRRGAVRCRRTGLRQARPAAARLHPVEPVRRQSRRQPRPPVDRQPPLAAAARPVRPGVPAHGRIRRALQLPGIPVDRSAVPPAALRRQPGVRGLPRRNVGVVSRRCGSDAVRAQARTAGVRRSHGRRRRYYVERQRLRRPGRSGDRHRRVLRRTLDRRRLDRPVGASRARRRPLRCTTSSTTAVRVSSAGSAAWPTTGTAGSRWRGPSWCLRSSRRPRRRWCLPDN